MTAAVAPSSYSLFRGIKSTLTWVVVGMSSGEDGWAIVNGTMAAIMGTATALALAIAGPTSELPRGYALATYSGERVYYAGEEVPRGIFKSIGKPVRTTRSYTRTFRETEMGAQTRRLISYTVTVELEAYIRPGREFNEFARLYMVEKGDTADFDNYLDNVIEGELNQAFEKVRKDPDRYRGGYVALNTPWLVRNAKVSFVKVE